MSRNYKMYSEPGLFFHANYKYNGSYVKAKSCSVRLISLFLHEEK